MALCLEPTDAVAIAPLAPHLLNDLHAPIKVEPVERDAADKGELCDASAEHAGAERRRWLRVRAHEEDEPQGGQQQDAKHEEAQRKAQVDGKVGARPKVDATYHAQPARR